MQELTKEIDMGACNEEMLKNGIASFLKWYDTTKGKSYDPYDLWGTRYGLAARRLYYRKNLLGTAMVAPVLLTEILCPGIRCLFVKTERYATADGQLLMGFLNLYHQSGDQTHLDQAIRLGSAMLEYSIPGYTGHCWGYPFDWQNNTGLWKKNLPFITATPYAFEAFLGLFDATGDESYLEIAVSTAQFVYSDLNDTKTSETASAGSYSPIDHSQVINATAYRAWVLFEASKRLDNDDYAAKARRNLNFVLENQREDGAWLYALASPGEAFIDHFHTCFVLKNLWKIYQLLKEPAILKAIRNGYAYYRKALFSADGEPKSFAIEPRLQLAKIEMYNYAESITLGALLADEIDGASELAGELAHRLCSRYQVPAGHFVTRVYLGGWRHTYPFLRWPQAQLFYALTNLLRVSSPEKQ